jgi:peroxiredoxin
MAEDSLNQQFAALHTHRVQTMNPVDLGVNIRQREYLVANADRSRFPKPGNKVPEFVLPDVEGGSVVLTDLLAKGPVVLVFFRFAGCPACNIALPHYERHLYPGLTARGVSLLALSPQVPEKLVEIKTRHNLSFRIASDTDNHLGKHFGIVFSPTAEAKANAEAKGSNTGETTGTGTWELPMPAVIVIGQDGIIRYADVSPDWLERTEAADILTALEPALT